jgi:hypothetical protein
VRDPAGTLHAFGSVVTPEQKCALTGLRQAAGRILPDVSSRPGRRAADIAVWLAELERGPVAYSRVRTIAGALRTLGSELEQDPDGRDSAATAATLIDAAEKALIAF